MKKNWRKKKELSEKLENEKIKIWTKAEKKAEKHRTNKRIKERKKEIEKEKNIYQLLVIYPAKW